MLALRKWLFSGLLVIVPLAITLWVLNWIIGTLDQTLWLLPEEWQLWVGQHRVRGLGVLFTLAILLGVGAIASNFVGKRLLGWGDAVVRRIPVVRSIYSSVKQVSDTLFSESGNAFRTAVLIEWPRPGAWTIAFVTGTPGGDVLNYLQEHRQALPVILMSGMPPDEIQHKMDKLRRHELPPLFIKPFDPEQLMEIVEMQLSGQLPEAPEMDAAQQELIDPSN